MKIMNEKFHDVKGNTRYLRYIKKFPENRDDNGFVGIWQAIPTLTKEEFDKLNKMCQKKKIIISTEGTEMYRFQLKA